MCQFGAKILVPFLSSPLLSFCFVLCSLHFQKSKENNFEAKMVILLTQGIVKKKKSQTKDSFATNTNQHANKKKRNNERKKERKKIKG